MSQAGINNALNNNILPADVPIDFVTDSGTAIASGNVLNVNGAGGATTSGSGNTIIVSSSASAAETLTPNSGAAVVASAGNINDKGLAANSGGNAYPLFSYNGGTAQLNWENRTYLTPYVVDASTTNGSKGTFTTVQSAITQAVADSYQGDIFLRSGTYTEDLTLAAGINLTALGGDGLSPTVKILGKATFTGAGTVSISNIQLQTNSDNFLVVSGSSASIVNLNSCYLNCANATGITYSSSSASSGVHIYYCNGICGSTGTLFNYSGAASLVNIFSSSIVGTTTTTASNTSGPVVQCDSCRFQFPLTTSSSGSYDLRNCILNTGVQNAIALTTAGSGSTSAIFCRFLGGTSSAISIGTGSSVVIQDCAIVSSNANQITGLGTLLYTPFTTNGNGNINVTTQTPKNFGPVIALPAGPQIMAGSGSPSGSVTAPQGSLYLRTDGSTSITRGYINTDSSTTWTAITTVG